MGWVGNTQREQMRGLLVFHNLDAAYQDIVALRKFIEDDLNVFLSV